MKIDAHGTEQNGGKINPLLRYLECIDDMQKWDYVGLTVQIDPTVDHQYQNMLVRWTDIDEGFNDRIIVESLDEFKTHFKFIKE